MRPMDVTGGDDSAPPPQWFLPFNHDLCLEATWHLVLYLNGPNKAHSSGFGGTLTAIC